MEVKKSITKDELRNIASLARIYLEDHELERLTEDLKDILQYVAKLQKLDVSQTPPTSHVFPLKNVYREDKVKPSLPPQEALKIAPDKHRESFRVPQVIE